MDEGQEKKYSCCLLIPKSDKKTLKKVKAAIEAATQAGKASKFGGKVPPSLRSPLRDGDEERPDDEAFEGHYFMNANSKNKPGIVDASRNPIMDQDEVYSGCYGYASVTMFAYNVTGNKGIACGLNHLMKTKDGDPLTSRSTAENDFAELELEEEDDDFLS